MPRINFQNSLLFFILAVGFLIKVPAFFNPLVGHFASYQALNAMMAEMMVRGSPSAWIIPQSFFVMDGQPALHLLYYPFGSLVSAVLTSLLGVDFDFWGRFQAALFAAASGWLVYLIAKRKFSRDIGILATFFFTFSPMVLLYGTSFQNESVAIFFLTTSCFLLLNQTVSSALLSGIFFSASIIARLHFVTVLPAFLYLAISGSDRKIKRMLVFSLASLLPAALWFGWMIYLEITSTNALTGLFGQLGEDRIIHEIISEPRFYSRMAELVLGRWLTPIGALFAAAGIFVARKAGIPFLLWWSGTLASAILLPKKTFDHPFYLLSGAPAAAILAAVAFNRFKQRFSAKVWRVSLIGLFFIISMRYYIPPAFTFTPLERSIATVGAEIERRTDATDRIIASHGAACDLLYYTRRRGWTFSFEIERVPIVNHARILKERALGHDSLIGWLEHGRSHGAKYFVLVEKETFKKETDFYSYVTERYPVVSKDEDPFLMFDIALHSKSQP